ncbi:MAG TPA: heparan-alpha-glucosaminide N-acetyltransferase domain-containing protein [Dermatophilaceae bacterium]|nr:heparan-alpha-glucosaminide N-acetyltransferase domain-containing protein [Dermatophilaceae bacterium]
MHAPSSPSTARRRLVGVDLARCVALVGMICTHLADPRTQDGQVTGLQQLAGGRSAATFAVLAGVSLSLVTGGREPLRDIPMARARASLGVRALLIATLGLWLGGMPSGVAVILVYYGVLFVLALPFLALRARTLALVAAGLAVVVPILGQLVRPHLPDLVGQPTFASLGEPGALVWDVLLTGTYPTVPWLAYLLLGMSLGRLRLARTRVATRLVLAGAVLAVAGWAVGYLVTRSTVVQEALVRTEGRLPAEAWAALEQRLIDGLHGTTPTGSWWWLLVAAPHSATTFDLFHTAGSAMVVLGLCLLVARRWTRQWAVIGGAGAMTLTLYTTHVWVAANAVPRTVAYATQFHLVLVLVLGAVFAGARVKGPLEALVTTASRATAAVMVGPTRPGDADHRLGPCPDPPADRAQ